MNFIYTLFLAAGLLVSSHAQATQIDAADWLKGIGLNKSLKGEVLGANGTTVKVQIVPQVDGSFAVTVGHNEGMMKVEFISENALTLSSGKNTPWMDNYEAVYISVNREGLFNEVFIRFGHLSYDNMQVKLLTVK